MLNTYREYFKPITLKDLKGYIYDRKGLKIYSVANTYYLSTQAGLKSIDLDTVNKLIKQKEYLIID